MSKSSSSSDNAQAHEAGVQAMDQDHERSLAQLQQDAEAMSQASD